MFKIKLPTKPIFLIFYIKN